MKYHCWIYCQFWFIYFSTYFSLSYIYIYIYIFLKQIYTYNILKWITNTENNIEHTFFILKHHIKCSYLAFIQKYHRLLTVRWQSLQFILLYFMTICIQIAQLASFSLDSLTSDIIHEMTWKLYCIIVNYIHIHPHRYFSDI